MADASDDHAAWADDPAPTPSAASSSSDDDVFEDSSAVPPLSDSPDAQEPSDLPAMDLSLGPSPASEPVPAADDSFDDVPFDDAPPASAAEDVAAPSPAADFDDFDDFDDPAAAPSAADGAPFGADDDFGDFGDFDEAGEGAQGATFDEMELNEPVQTPSSEPALPPASAAPAYPTLNLQPLPDPSTLAALIQEILRPVFPDLDADAQLGADEVREVPGLGQVLVNQSGRDLYESLTSPPELAALDWTRSRVRREHLINLGVPVNLDEVASSKAPSLPPLRIITNTPARPVSTPPIDRTNGAGPKRANTIGGSSLAPRRAGPNQAVRSGSTTPRSAGPAADVDLGIRGRQEKTYGLGKKPEVNMDRARGLLDHASDSLSLMSLASLEALQISLRETASEASAQLSHLLQLRDAQQNEALVSNGMIAELVMNAQKAALAGKTGGGGSGGGWRRSVGSRSPAPG